MTGPRRSGRPSGINAVGLTGAPSAAAPVAPIPAPATEPSAEVASSRARDVTAPSRPAVSAPRATAETTVSYTVRFDARELLDVDRLSLWLRHESGRRTLDRSEIIRTLLRLAGDDANVRAALVQELTTS